MAIQNNNRKFLDQAGIVKLVQGLNAKYAAMYAVKGSEKAEGVAYSNTTMGASVTDVKGALDVLVDNVVRQNGEQVSLNGNMKAVEAKIDAEVLRAQGEEKKNANAIAVINELLGQGQTGNAGSIAERLAALESFKTGHSHEAIEKDIDDLQAAVEKLNGPDTEAGSVAKAVKDAMDAHEAAREEVDAAIAERFEALEAVVDPEGESVAKQVQGVQDALDTFVDGTFAGYKQTVQAALDEKADNADLEDAVDRIDELESFVGEHDHQAMIDRIAANEEDIARLDGAVDVEGSVKKQIKDAIDAVNDAAGDLEDRVKANEDKLAGLDKATVKAEIEQAQADAEAEAARLDGELKAELQKEIDDDVKVVADELDKQKDADQEGTLAHQIATEVARAKAAEEANAAAIKVEKDRMDAFMAAADVQEGAIDTLKEIQDYITSDGQAANQMVKDIAAAKKAGDDAQADVDALDAYVKGVEGAGGLEQRIAANEAFVAAQPAIDKAQDDRIKALEDANKDGGAVKEAIDAVADDLAEALEAQATKDGQQDDAIQAVVDALADEKDATKNGSLAKQIADEVVARGNADVALAARIAVFEKDGAQDVAAKEVRLAALEAKFEGENSVDAKIAAAQAAAEKKAADLDTALEAKLQGNIDLKVAQSAYDEKVAELAQADTDNLAEAKKYADDEIAEAIAQEVIDRNDAIKVEEDRAKLAEKANADAITAIKDGAVMNSFADVEAEFAKFGFLTDDEIAAAITEAFGE